MTFSFRPRLLAVLISAGLPLCAQAFTHNVAAGDTITGETVTDAPGEGNVQSVYGTANDTLVTGNGFQDVENGGVANNSTLTDNGKLNVAAGGTASNTAIDDTSRLLNFGGTVNGADVYGYLQNSNGVDHDVVIESGGRYFLTGSGGTALSENATIKDGADVTVFGPAEADDWHIDGNVTVNRNIGDTDGPVFNHATLEDDAFVQLNYNAVMNDTVMNGGRLNVWASEDPYIATVNNTTQNGGTLTVGYGGIAQDSTVNGGLFRVNGGDVTNTVVNTGGTLTNNAGHDTATVVSGGAYTLDGSDATASDLTVQGSIADIVEGVLDGTATLSDGAQLNVSATADTAGADLVVDDSTLYLAGTGDYQFADVSLNDGGVAFSHSTPAYSSLTLDSLSGSGTLYMNTDVAGGAGDHLTVTGDADGEFGVFVQDTGVSPDRDDTLTLINTGGGSGNFSLANTGGVVDLGTYEYHLVIDGDHQWSLAAKPGDVTPVGPVVPVIPPVITPEITPSTAAVLGMATLDPLVFAAELTSVRHRLEETRGFSHDTHGWVDVISEQNDVHTAAGAGLDQTLTGITAGVDRSLQREHGVTTQGVFFSSSHSDAKFDRGGGGDVDSLSLGGYASYLDDNGGYIDGIVKANRLDHDVSARMTSGSTAGGDYDTSGLGAHIEAGRYFRRGSTWFKPYGALTAFTTGNTAYHLSNGMQAHVGNARSVRAEAGVNAGLTLALDNGMTLQPYAGIAVTQEFIDDNRVEVNQDGHFVNDLSGTRGTYEAGLRAQVNDTMTAHVSLSYANGAGVESPWVANTGVAWRF